VRISKSNNCEKFSTICFTEEFINSVFVSSGNVAVEGRKSIRYFRENESIEDCVQVLTREILIFDLREEVEALIALH